jgi:hypothetical protein
MAKARSCLCTTAAHACQGQAVHRRGEEGARSSHRTSSLQGASRSIEAAGFVTWPCMARLKSGRLGAHVARHPINFGILWNPRPPPTTMWRSAPGACHQERPRAPSTRKRAKSPNPGHVEGQVVLARPIPVVAPWGARSSKYSRPATLNRRGAWQPAKYASNHILRYTMSMLLRRTLVPVLLLHKIRLRRAVEDAGSVLLPVDRPAGHRARCQPGKVPVPELCPIERLRDHRAVMICSRGTLDVTLCRPTFTFGYVRCGWLVVLDETFRFTVLDRRPLSLR